MTFLQSRASTCWDLFAYAAFLSSFSCVGSIKVTVPEGHLVAVRGHPAILGCVFTPDPGLDLSTLVITWQRLEDSRVVHSYYYQQDQLEVQSEEYRNRTSLFHTELSTGNASLKIEDVVPSDMGRYQCMVSSSSGTDRAELQLDYGAFFTEPRLSISFSAADVSVQYEAEGFPKPEVRWLGEKGQNLSHHTELSEGTEREAGIYHLKSSYVAHTPALNITFVLKNELLHQYLQRPVSFSYAGNSSNGVVVVLTIICVLLLITVLILTWLHWHKKK